jgi:hypothetical protein
MAELLELNAFFPAELQARPHVEAIARVAVPRPELRGLILEIWDHR